MRTKPHRAGLIRTVASDLAPTPAPPSLTLAARLRAVLRSFAVGFALVLGSVAIGQERSGDPSAKTGATGQVDIDVLQFGAGDACRPGDWVGVQISVQDRVTKVRSLVLRLSVVDADGDTAQLQVVQPAQSGQKRTVWLYGRMPFSAIANPTFQISAFEGEDRGDGVIRPGRLVGSLAYMVKGVSIVPPTSGMFGVVGRQFVGLDRYTVRTTNGPICTPLGHELVHPIPSLKPGQKGQPGELPDRWFGLSQFDVIVWTSSGADGEPTDLVPAQAEALREWVERGGHLVIMLSSVGQSWLTNSLHPLSDIMPRCSAGRMENVPMEPLRPLLMGKSTRALPSDQIVYVLQPDPAAEPGQAIRLFNDAEGRCIAARRLVGAGAVTVLGIDLASRGFLQRGGVEPDVFWHRVLGRRGTLVTNEDVANLSTRKGLFVDPRSPLFYDLSIPGAISKFETASLGILMAFGVFLAYWVLAGPLGFAVLKRKNWSQHAWIGFVVVGGLFTAIAWGGATALRPLTVSATHLTFFDQVYGQGRVKARAFMSVLLPKYGDVLVSVASDNENRLRQGLFSFDTPQDAGQSASHGFPDARGYPVDARQPASAEVPARSTTKDFQIDWAGGPPWKMITPVVDSGKGQYQPGGAIVPLVYGDKTPHLSGLLMHELPFDLSDVDILYVQGQNLASNTAGVQPSEKGGAITPALLPSEVFQASLPTWRPGQVIDLGTIFGPKEAASQRGAGDRYLSSLVPGVSQQEIDRDPTRSRESAFEVSRNLKAIAFMSVLPQPLFNNNAAFASGPTLARRRITHGLDLGRWFTQPCVIIVGHIGDQNTAGTCPVPISVDGEDPSSLTKRITGRTVVRWVYPLPDRPPRIDRPQETPSPSP